MDVILYNPKHVVALLAHIQLRRQSSNQRVLPTYYSDNYVSFLPGESRTISVEAAQRDLGDDQPLVVLDGWNVTTKRESFSDGSGKSSIGPNGDAQVDSVPTGDWTVLRPTKALSRPAAVGIFEDDGDIGKVIHPGKVEYDPSKQTYTITGNGENMWADHDAFHFLWKKVSGDFSLEAEVSFIGAGKNPHRKACLLVRQSLDANSAYADAALHGVGLTSLQFRDQTGADTHEIQSNITAPARLRLEKRGDDVYMFLAARGRPFEFSGASLRLKFQEPFYVGLGVCSHDKDVSETAVFSNIHLVMDPPPANRRPELYSTLETITIASTDRRVTRTAPGHAEAPNWTPDARPRFCSIVTATFGGTPSRRHAGGN